MTDTAVANIQDSKITVAQAGQALLFNNMPEVMRGAELMASAKDMVPQHLRSNPGGCMAIIMQAQRWGMDPFAVAQKTHLVHGTLGYESQLVNAVVTTMAPTTGRIQYEWFGDWDRILGKFTMKQSQKGGDYAVPAWDKKDEEGLGVKVWATMKGEDKPRELAITMSQVTVRNSTLWASDPRQQLAYLAVKRWARLHCPDVILGVYTRDEIEPRAEPRDITPSAEPEGTTGARTESVKKRLLDDEEAEDAVIEPVGEESPAPEPGPEQSEDALTFAQVAEAIRTADKLEKLAAVGNVMVPDFLGEGDNAQYKQELTDLYKARQTELKAIADEQKQ